MFFSCYYSNQYNSSINSLKSKIRKFQPLILTSDWRRKISVESLRLLSNFTKFFGSDTPLTKLHTDSFIDILYLPYISNYNPNTTQSLSIQQHQQFLTDESILKTTRTALVGLCKVVNTTYRIELHALVLLQR